MDGSRKGKDKHMHESLFSLGFIFKEKTKSIMFTCLIAVIYDHLSYIVFYYLIWNRPNACNISIQNDSRTGWN